MGLHAALLLAVASVPFASAQSSTSFGGATPSAHVETLTGDRTTITFDRATASLPAGATAVPPDGQSNVALPEFPTTDEDAPPWVVVAIAARVAVNGSIPFWVPNSVLDPAKEVAKVIVPNVTLPLDGLPYWFVNALSQHLAEPGASVPKWIPNDILINAEEPAVKARPQISGSQTLSALPPACTGAGPTNAASGGGTTSSSSAAPANASGAAFTKGDMSWMAVVSAVFIVALLL